MLLDVSHLAPAGFWELAERSKRPFIASHSNSAAICGHPRNLSDEQIQALIAVDGRMGLTFVPWFVRDGEERRLMICGGILNMSARWEARSS